MKYLLQVKKSYLGISPLIIVILSNQICDYLVLMFVILQRSSFKRYMVDFQLNVNDLTYVSILENCISPKYPHISYYIKKLGLAWIVIIIKV